MHTPFRVRLGPALASTTLMVLFGAGCHHRARSAASDCSTPRDHVRIALGAMPNTLDWSKSNTSSAVNYPVIQAMMRGLTRLDAHHRAVPDLAKSWDVSLTKDSPPHQVYTFHLRRGLVWSDGKTPVTAEDFVFGWRRGVSGNTPSEFSAILGADAVMAARNLDPSKVPAAEIHKRLAAALSHFGVKALDAHTLQVTLSEPRSYFLARIANVYPFFPAPSADLKGKTEEQIDRYYNEPKDGKPMSLGAFKLVRWDRVGNEVDLVNNRFDPDAPKHGAVKRLSLIKATLSPLLYEKCKIDFLAMDDPASLKTAPPDTAHTELLSTVWLGMNTRRLNLPLRQAISYAIDRAAAVRGLVPDVRPAFGFLPPDLPGAVGPGDPLAKDFPVHDLARAKKLLATAHYDGHPLSMLVEAAGHSFIPEAGIADAIRRQLAPLGIHVVVTTTIDYPHDIVDPANHQVRFDLFLRRTGADFAHPQTFLTQFDTDGNNFTGWESVDGGKTLAAYHQLLVEGGAESDPEKMKEIYSRAQSLLLAKAAAMVPIYYPDRFYRKRTWIHGLGFDPFNFLTFASMRVGAPATSPKKP